MAVHDFKSQRLFVENGLVGSTTFDASREQANYLLNVLRMKTGDSILAFNGRDGEWRCEIEATGRKKCSLTPKDQTRPQPGAPEVTYFFAPLKQARLDYMIQKAVEMGVNRLQPVITEYTQIRSVNEKRLLTNAIGAAEQCGILSLPNIEPAIKLPDLPAAYPKDIPLIFCDEEAAEIELQVSDKKPDKGFGLLIGPEGGFSESERLMVKSWEHVITLGLGPRILRADTAAIAALAVLQSRIGDWYE